jgi:hypothetical protein
MTLLLDYVKRRAKRILANQGYLDRFYPHSMLTLAIQMVVAYNETEKFTKIWCGSDSNVVEEITAVKEIFEVENKDDMTWMVELIANKYTAENIDRLAYIVFTVKR